MNILDLILWGQKQCEQISSSPRLDAEILLSFSLQKDHSYLRTWPEKTPSDKQAQDYKQLIQKRLKPTPVAYLIGYKEFWSRNFKVNSATLIPRPDTECLVEQALNFLPDNGQKSVLDLGTGSGCIAITLKKERENCLISATDISSDALSIAQENAQQHKAGIQFIQSSWFDSIPKQRFNLIVSNPPYIKENDQHLSQGDLPAEPITALTSGDSGLNDIKIITQHAMEYLHPKGCLMIEHGYDQEVEVNALFQLAEFIDIEPIKDLNGLTRVTLGRAG